MDNTRKERLILKYSKSRGESTEKRHGFSNHQGRATEMAAKGKPKDLKKTVKRLLSFLSEQKLVFFTAVFFSILNTAYSDCVPMRNLPPQMPMPELT